MTRAKCFFVKTKNFARGEWVEKHFSQWVTTIVIMIHMGLAMAIISGGVERFAIPSYNPLVEYTQGHVWIWGAWIGISGILISVPFKWPNVVGLWLGMTFSIVWMVCFTIAVVRYDNAASTTIPMYGGLAVLNTALLTARVLDKD